MSPAPRPKVLFVGDHFGYANGVVHGVSTYYQNVLPALRAAGAEVHCCFLRGPHPAAAPLEEQGIGVEFLDAHRLNLFLAGDVERIARRMGANVLHVAAMKSALLGRIVARRTGARLLVHAHDLHVPPAPLRWLYGRWEVPGIQGLAVSTAAADNMEHAYRIPRAAVTVLPNAIDVDSFAEGDRGSPPQGIPATPPRVLWAGRLHDIKGPQRMIRIGARLTAARPDLTVLLAGDGPGRQGCERLVAQLGVGDRVRLLGQRPDLRDVYRHVELLCVTSHNEGFSLVAAEAAASGVPAVAFDVGGVGEVVLDGRTGRLVTDGDEDTFVATVLGLLEDDSRRRALGAEAASAVRRFGMQAHIDALMRLYGQALA